MAKDGGTPWQVWAAVTLLAAAISTFGKLYVDRASTSPPIGVSALDIKDQGPSQFQGGLSVAAPLSATDWTERLGTYTGESINRVTRNSGFTVLDLKSLEPSGKIRGSVEWSNGLYGTGLLVGNAKGDTLFLSGTILSVETGIWDSDVTLTFASADSISGTYRLYPQSGNPNGTQYGQFTLKRTR